MLSFVKLLKLNCCLQQAVDKDNRVSGKSGNENENEKVRVGRARDQHWIVIFVVH